VVTHLQNGISCPSAHILSTVKSLFIVPVLNSGLERLSEVNCKCGNWDYKARNSETEC